MGDVSENNVCLCYLESCVDKKVLDELRTRLSKVKSSAILDTNYIAEQIRDSDTAPFRTIGATERPDIVAAKLLEGRVAVFSEAAPRRSRCPLSFWSFSSPTRITTSAITTPPFRGSFALSAFSFRF